MFRTRGAVALVVVAALAAAACGGTDWNAARKAKPLSPAQLRAAAVAQARAERPYINALVASDQASEPAGGVNALDSRCFAVAVVRGYGVKAFIAHGLTPNGLRNPNSTLNALPTPTAAQADAIGTAVQRCHLDALGRSLAVTLDTPDARTAGCLTNSLHRPEARRFLALWMLGRNRVNLAVAHAVVGLIVKCVDLAEVFVRAADVPPGAGVRQCLITALHSADAELKDFSALLMSDADQEQLQQVQEQLGVVINQCRPGAQTGFTVPAN